MICWVLICFSNIKVRAHRTHPRPPHPIHTHRYRVPRFPCRIRRGKHHAQVIREFKVKQIAENIHFCHSTRSGMRILAIYSRKLVTSLCRRRRRPHPAAWDAKYRRPHRPAVLPYRDHRHAGPRRHWERDASVHRRYREPTAWVAWNFERPALPMDHREVRRR